MFNSKKIAELEKEIKKMQDKQHDFMKNMLEIVTKIQSSSKKYFAWELRQEEIDCIEEGKKVKKIRKILG